jgi:ribonucleotide reductase beta subunit family protein with ferritin-like domain
MAALRMASTFAMFENAIHQPFYNKINELLHINNPDFYKSYLDNPTLKERMDYIGQYISHPNELVSLGVFSLVEGVVLYSNFAFLKHFQSQGKNKLLNFVRGINFSLRDENLHSVAGAFAFKYKLNRANLNEAQWIELVSIITDAARKMYEHEVEIIKMIFEEGPIDGITKTQMIHFVESRINECLIQLGISPIYAVKNNPIAEWFYKAINDYSFNDNFSGISNQYHRNWDESRFGYVKAKE